VTAAAAGLGKVFRYLEAAGLGGFARFDASLVRGLAYYTGTVFEIWQRSGELRAVCGGGRYDDLLASLGGVDLPALGFGMGDVVLGELLAELGLAPSLEQAVDDYVVCVSDDEREVALAVAHRLRSEGRRVLYDLRLRGVSRQFKTANQLGASRAIIVGPEEVERGEVIARVLATGEEGVLPLSELVGGSGTRHRWGRKDGSA
jgi:histidyl-tRNA synthetase